jgi:hypothetical protein
MSDNSDFGMFGRYKELLVEEMTNRVQRFVAKGDAIICLPVSHTELAIVMPRGKHQRVPITI